MVFAEAGHLPTGPKMHTPPTIALPPMPAMTDDERLAAAQAFADELARRRTVRDYAPTPVPRTVIEQCLRAAGSAPSGANQQPWRFVAVQDMAPGMAFADIGVAGRLLGRPDQIDRLLVAPDQPLTRLPLADCPSDEALEAVDCRRRGRNEPRYLVA